MLKQKAEELKMLIEEIKKCKDTEQINQMVKQTFIDNVDITRLKDLSEKIHLSLGKRIVELEED